MYKKRNNRDDVDVYLQQASTYEHRAALDEPQNMYLLRNLHSFLYHAQEVPSSAQKTTEES